MIFGMEEGGSVGGIEEVLFVDRGCLRSLDGCDAGGAKF